MQRKLAGLHWDAGERGIACHPNRVGEFQDGVGKAIEYAKALGTPQLNCLAGIVPQGVTPQAARAYCAAHSSEASRSAFCTSGGSVSKRAYSFWFEFNR